MNCNVCFENVYCLKCIDYKNCSSNICKECFDNYVNYCIDNKCELKCKF